MHNAAIAPALATGGFIFRYTEIKVFLLVPQPFNSIIRMSFSILFPTQPCVSVNERLPVLYLTACTVFNIYIYIMSNVVLRNCNCCLRLAV